MKREDLFSREDNLKESEKREALEKAGQGNLFTTQRGR
jgi:hypothetical protein